MVRIGGPLSLISYRGRRNERLRGGRFSLHFVTPMYVDLRRCYLVEDSATSIVTSAVKSAWMFRECEHADCFCSDTTTHRGFGDAPPRGRQPGSGFCTGFLHGPFQFACSPGELRNLVRSDISGRAAQVAIDITSSQPSENGGWVSSVSRRGFLAECEGHRSSC